MTFDLPGPAGRLEALLTEPPGARFAAVALTISAQQIALDRGLVGRVFSLQRGAGARLLNQRILRIPELQRRLNLPQGLQRLNLPQNIPQQQLQRQLQQQPRLQRPSIQTGPSGPGSIPMPRLPSIPNIGR